MCGGGLEGPPRLHPASLPAPMPGIPVFCLDGGYQYFGIRPDRAGSGAGTSGIAARAGVKPLLQHRVRTCHLHPGW